MNDDEEPARLTPRTMEEVLVAMRGVPLSATLNELNMLDLLHCIHQRQGLSDSSEKIGRCWGEGVARCFKVQPSGSQKDRRHLAEIEEVVCPISTTLLEDPVVTVDGSVYERRYIDQWFRQRRIPGMTPTSPATGLELSCPILMPLEMLRGIVEAFLEHRPEVATFQHRANLFAESLESVKAMQTELEMVKQQLEGERATVSCLQARVSCLEAELEARTVTDADLSDQSEELLFTSPSHGLQATSAVPIESSSSRALGPRASLPDEPDKPADPPEEGDTIDAAPTGSREGVLARIPGGEERVPLQPATDAQPGGGQIHKKNKKNKITHVPERFLDPPETLPERVFDPPEVLPERSRESSLALPKAPPKAPPQPPVDTRASRVDEVFLKQMQTLSLFFSEEDNTRLGVKLDPPDDDGPTMEWTIAEIQAGGLVHNTRLARLGDAILAINGENANDFTDEEIKDALLTRPVELLLWRELHAGETYPGLECWPPEFATMITAEVPTNEVASDTSNRAGQYLAIHFGVQYSAPLGICLDLSMAVAKVEPGPASDLVAKGDLLIAIDDASVEGHKPDRIFKELQRRPVELLFWRRN